MEFWTKRECMTVAELRDFLKDLPGDLPVYFFTHDDAWDSAWTIAPGFKSEGDSIYHFSDIAEVWEKDEPLPTRPNCIVITGHHN